ncbi:hypothetical protein [Falsigemmobacter faecalis]|uniref:Uncharacterized protein n=1 Tax=Falsigemmobacter faecalis TaxID=2488730 RepID=A0A3P3DNG4_9RHOB|nr:hypothetical protein [Falsigemmobacter faecalis]RRH75787.1 hypothetical protein EG244_07620 [Falsigemmobacter faecalis]
MPRSAPPLSAPRTRIVVLRRRPEAGRSNLRNALIGAGMLALLAVGIQAGYRIAGLFSPEPVAVVEAGTLVERVNGGLYTLELARPAGQARWMLEFDADIVTREGPDNPLELRDALERLVITASSMPLVQTSSSPDEAMRTTILAVAASHYPWLVDIHMRRSDIRAPGDKLKEIGASIRGDR